MTTRKEFTDKTKGLVRERQNGCCAACGGHEDDLFDEEGLKVNFHHILSAAAQGSNKTFNCVMICEDCHDNIHLHGHYHVPIVTDLNEFPYANMNKTETENFYKMTGSVMMDYIVNDYKAGSLSYDSAVDRVKQIFGDNSFLAKAGLQFDSSITYFNRKVKGKSMPKFSMSDEMLAKGNSTTRSTSRRSSGELPSFNARVRQGAAVIADSDNMRYGAEDLKSYQHYLQNLCNYTEDLLRQAHNSWQDSDYDTLYRAWRSVREKIESFQHHLHDDIKHLENKAAQIDNV